MGKQRKKKLTRRMIDWLSKKGFDCKELYYLDNSPNELVVVKNDNTVMHITKTGGELF